MSISEKDVKLLWARSAGRCAFPECDMKLTQDKMLSSASYPVGEQAHIVGEGNYSPRSKSNLTQDERNSYYNLILLCPNHHTIVDKDIEQYSIERLRQMKAQHEYWVETTFTNSTNVKEEADSIVYADLLDSTVVECRFEDWERWTIAACSTTMTWDKDAYPRALKYFEKIVCAVWPKTIPELECAIKRLAVSITDGIELFYAHCEEQGNVVREVLE